MNIDNKSLSLRVEQLQNDEHQHIQTGETYQQQILEQQEIIENQTLNIEDIGTELEQYDLKFNELQQQQDDLKSTNDL